MLARRCCRCAVAVALVALPVRAAAQSNLSAPTTLAPVTVTATRTPLAEVPVPASVTVLERDTVVRSTAIVLDDLLREQVPGFTTYRQSSSLAIAPQEDPEAQGLTLRGIGPGGASRALLMLDGIPVNDAFSGSIYWGELTLDNIERIEVVRGGTSNLWGNFALGGAINVISQAPTPRSGSLRLSGGTLGTTSDDASYGDVFGPLSLRVHVNGLHTEGYNIVERNQRGPIDHDSGVDHVVIANEARFTPRSDLSLFFRGAYYEETRDNGTRLRTSNAERGFLAAGGRLRTDDGSEWTLTAFSHVSEYRQTFSTASDDRTSETRSQNQRIPATDAGAGLTWARKLAGGNVLSAGSDVRWVVGHSRDTFFDDSGALVAEQRKSGGQQEYAGLFVQDVWTPVSELTVSGGARIDYVRSYDGHVDDTMTGMPTTRTRLDESGHEIWSARLGARYAPVEQVAFRAAGYRSFRAPTLAELYRQSSVEDLVLLANPRLKPETLYGGEVGFDLTPVRNVTLAVTGFWNDIQDPITNVTTATDPVTGADSQRSRVNLGLARIRGFETDLQFRVTPSWTLFGGYVYSEARLLRSKQDTTLEGRWLTEVPQDSARVGARFHDPSLVDCTVQWRYEGRRFEDADNGDDLDAYAVVDISLAREFRAPSWLQPVMKRGRAFVTIENALNEHYVVDKGGDVRKNGTPRRALFGITALF